MGFVTAAPENFHKSMDKAFALMLRCSVAELWIQSSQDLMEGMEALTCVLSFTLGDLVAGAGDTHDTHDTHGLHIGTYKFRLRTGYTELFVRNKLQVRALRDRA